MFWIIIIILVCVVIALKMDLNYGWVHLNNKTLQITCKDWNIDITALNIDITQMIGDKRIAVYLGEIKRVLKLTEVYLKTADDFHSLIAQMKSLNASGTWRVDVQLSGPPLATTYLKMDGTNEGMYVFCSKQQGGTKAAAGNGTIFKFKTLEFLEAESRT